MENHSHKKTFMYNKDLDKNTRCQKICHTQKILQEIF